MVFVTTNIKEHKQKGFTVIEILVTLGIALLLASILVFNGREGNQTLEVKRASQELVAELRRTQSYSLSTKIAVDDCQSQGNQSKGWGVQIFHQPGLPGQYTVFGNCNANPGFQTGTSDVLLAEKVLPNVEIEVIAPSNFAGGGGNIPSLEVVFEPPVPDTDIERNNNISSFRLRLTHLDNTQKCVEVWGNRRGNFWIDETVTCP